MKPVTVVWLKELLDTLRDRRTLMAMVIAPVLVMPLLIVAPQYLVRQQLRAQEAAALRVAVAGAPHAPGLMRFLQDQGVTVVLTDEPEAAVRDGTAPVALVIGGGFEAAVEAGRPAHLAVLGDGTKLASTRQAARLEDLLRGYGEGIVARRLAARGLDARLLEPFTLERRNLATPRQMGGAFLGSMLPLFVVLWALVGGMYTAIDVTAGEKERQTLEPLLGTPASRLQIVLGKLLAVITTSLAATVLAVGSMLGAFVVAEPLLADAGTEMAFRVSPGTALLVLAAALPVVVMFAALELAVCVFARSFKEAQNYIVPLQFVVLIPAVAVIVAPDLTPPLAAFAMPVFGPLTVLRNLFLGTATAAQFGVMFGASLAYAGLSLALAVQLFYRERVLFRT